MRRRELIAPVGGAAMRHGLSPGSSQMRLEKAFLAKLLGIDESEITTISGLSFEIAPDSLPTYTSLANEAVKKRAEALVAALSAEDDLGKIIRASIYIEHELQDFIFIAAPCPDQLRFDYMEFSEKVHLALVLGLNAELKMALNAIGNLRNKFAHRLDMKIEEDKVKNMIASLVPSAKQRFQGFLKGTLPRLNTQALVGDGVSYFNLQSRLMIFYVTVFAGVADERRRLALEKMRRMASK